MNLYEYIAVNNSLGANELLKNYGLKPTRSIDEIINRLKIIVRKYKKDALQDISKIHPDKELISSFNSSNIEDKNFAYATGRTPNNAEYQIDRSNMPSGDLRDVEGRMEHIDALKKIAEVKEQMLVDKVNNSRNELDRRISNTQYGNSPVILLAIGFAVGYMIAKK
ncbi:hypothetical protein OAD75_06350 [Gammaproteobacteria bacterium]|nr:hypothetical protein [Gammaproteobacteria bacterium]